MPKISIVMTTFNRPLLLAVTLMTIFKQAIQDYEVIVVDDGTDEKTPKLCDAFAVDGFPLKYVRVNRPASETYRNQAQPLNAGIRQATGEIIILQNAECAHIDSKTISKLTEGVTDTSCVFAKVISLYPDGSQDTVYCGKDNPRPYFFCGAIKRAWLEKLRGFDEDYTGYGYEDDDMADRLRHEGVTWVFTDVEVHHQWHPPAGKPVMSSAVYDAKTAAMKMGQLGTVRNKNKEWGCATA